jgi:hypothetical protein
MSVASFNSDARLRKVPIERGNAPLAPAHRWSPPVLAKLGLVGPRSLRDDDAWDHSIKAVEEMVIPILLPGKPKATLGQVLAELDKHPGAHSLAIQSKGSAEITTLTGMLRLIWVNPDRHGGDEHRIPGLSEAGGVLHVAVTIVQWAREELVA